MHIQINLVPDAILQQRREALLKRYATYALGGWLGLITLVGLALFGFNSWTSNQLQSARDEQARLNAEVNSADNVAFRTEARQVQTSLDALATLFLDQLLPSDLLRDLGSNIPSAVVVRNINVDDDQQVSFQAFAPSYDIVSSLIAALETSEARAQETESGYFTAVTVGRVINSSDSDSLQFNIVAKYVQAAAEPPEELKDVESIQAPTSDDDSSTDTQNSTTPTSSGGEGLQ